MPSDACGRGLCDKSAKAWFLSVFPQAVTVTPVALLPYGRLTRGGQEVVELAVFGARQEGGDLRLSVDQDRAGRET